MTFTISEWNDQRNEVFLDRYALRDSAGELLETIPEQMWGRVASELADGDEGLYNVFRDALGGFGFVPAGRVLSGLGSRARVTLYNCFVLGVRSRDPAVGNDSRRAIIRTVEEMIEITCRGGGVGINWSTLRPSGAYIRGVNGHSSGAVSWMSGADAMVNSIRQGGSRTAALMYILDDWHPDVLEFAEASFSRANHSVAVSDKFMNCVVKDLDWDLIFPDTTFESYNQIWSGDIDRWMDNGYPVIHYKTIRARDLWNTMCTATARTGNPGMVFLERANRQSNTRYFETLTATNPCGEQFLPVDGCCNLGSINLVSCWDPEIQRLDLSRLDFLVNCAVHMMDRIIDLSEDINSDIGGLQREVRRIGLGTMGLADVMLLSGIRYGSDESIEFIDTLYGHIAVQAYTASMNLARELGPAPAFKTEFASGEFPSRLPSSLVSSIRRHGLRNLTLTNQAPTGTISVLAGVSSGIEPVFAREYTRRDATGEWKVTHPLFDGVGDHMVTSMDIPPEDHIRVQSAIQRWCDNSISKTINLPIGSTHKDVSEAYHKAWESGCKGITVYVAGSREGVLELECPTGVCEV